MRISPRTRRKAAEPTPESIIFGLMQQAYAMYPARMMPSIIIRSLNAAGFSIMSDADLDAEIAVVEPYVSNHPKFPLRPLDEAIADADIVLLLCAHKQFKKISQTLLAEKIVIDTCGILR